MEIRFATINDLPGILALYAQLNPDDPPIDAATAAGIWEAGESGDILRYVVAADSEIIVGTCNVAVIPNLTRAGRPYAVIENVITDRDRRGKGIGRAIVEKAVDFAKARGCYKVLLLSSAKRKEAHRFYEAIGFDGTSKKGFQIRL